MVKNKILLIVSIFLIFLVPVFADTEVQFNDTFNDYNFTLWDYPGDLSPLVSLAITDEYTLQASQTSIGTNPPPSAKLTTNSVQLFSGGYGVPSFKLSTDIQTNYTGVINSSSVISYQNHLGIKASIFSYWCNIYTNETGIYLAYYNDGITGEFSTIELQEGNGILDLFFINNNESIENSTVKCRFTPKINTSNVVEATQPNVNLVGLDWYVYVWMFVEPSIPSGEPPIPPNIPNDFFTTWDYITLTNETYTPIIPPEPPTPPSPSTGLSEVEQVMLGVAIIGGSLVFLLSMFTGSGLGYIITAIIGLIIFLTVSLSVIH